MECGESSMDENLAQRSVVCRDYRWRQRQQVVFSSEGVPENGKRRRDRTQ